MLFLFLIMLSFVNLVGIDVEFVFEKILELIVSYYGYGWMLFLKFRKE